MKKFSPLALIRKYQFVIIAAAVLAGIAAVYIFNRIQTYTATTVVEYTNEAAEEGLAPDGTNIDTSEIYSADVMKEVFQRMNLEYDDYNLDQFRSKVSVVPIQTNEEAAVQEAMNEEGEEVETEPTRYQVSVTLSRNDVSDPEAFSRQLLDNMLDVFLEKYGEMHVNNTTFVNHISELNQADHDYPEIIELIETSVASTVASLSGYNDVLFTSSENGYSFSDIYRELGLFQSGEIPDIYAYILNNQVTKDRDILISKYRNRIEEYGINNSSYQEQIDDITEIIDAYVTMMRESGNTEITYEYILDQVYDNYYYTQQEDESGEIQQVPQRLADETVQYDVLLENYVSNRSSYEYALIDSAYCEYIIDLYSDSDTAVSADTSEEQQEQVAAMLDSLVQELNDVYGRLDQISSEFNEYSGAMNVSLNSDIVVTEGIQILLYTGIVVVVFMLATVAAVLVAGRLGDIINYYMYTDRKLMLPNRNGCDRYLNRNGNAVLSNDFVCIAISLTDIQEKNKQYGREKCDAMIERFAELLKHTFPLTEDNLIAVNGIGQFVVFLSGTTEEQAEAYVEYLSEEADEYNMSAQCKMEYCCGIAHAQKDHIFRIRDLMVRAINKTRLKDRPVQEENGNPKQRKEATDQEYMNKVREQADDGDMSEARLQSLLERLENIKRG